MNRKITGMTAGAMAAAAGAVGVSAQTRIQDRFFGTGDEAPTDVVSSGNGGVATSSASGGAVSVEDINSGGNAGNAVGVGDTYGGPVAVDGGDVGNLTTLGITSNGGTSISDASGGSYNLAFVS